MSDATRHEIRDEDGLLIDFQGQVPRSGERILLEKEGRESLWEVVGIVWKASEWEAIRAIVTVRPL